MKKSRHKNKKVFNFSFSYKHNGGNGAEEYEDLEWAEGRVKKKISQISFFQRLPSFFQICVVYITVYARDRATKKDSKTSRQSARKEATTSGDIFVVEEERREFKRVLRCFSA